MQIGFEDGVARPGRTMGRPMMAPPRRGHAAAWGAMIGPDNPTPGPSAMRTTGHIFAV